jgi:DNA-binding response OmpR family regulator
MKRGPILTAVRVLLVDDDARFAGALETALRQRGYEVLRAPTAADALRLVPDHRGGDGAAVADIVLLDLGLPDGDGTDVCRELRRRGDVPIIAVTARGEEHERVLGLRSGADDYVVKPFGMAELQARMEAVLRRSNRPTSAPRQVHLGSLIVDLHARRVSVDGREVALTRKEFDLLASLARRSGGAVTRDQLLAEVWHTTWAGSVRTVEVHVASLRCKLGDPGIVQTVRGVGYRLRAS